MLAAASMPPAVRAARNAPRHRRGWLAGYGWPSGLSDTLVPLVVRGNREPWRAERQLAHQDSGHRGDHGPLSVEELGILSVTPSDNGSRVRALRHRRRLP